MTDHLEISTRGVKAEGVMTIVILVLVAALAGLGWLTSAFMNALLIKLDEATFVSSLTDDQKRAVHLTPPPTLRSRVSPEPKEP